MQRKQPVCNFIGLGCFLLACLFCSFPAAAVASPDPLKELVNSKPKNQALKFSPTFEGRGDGLVTCPVSGEKVTKKSLKAEYLAELFIFVVKGV